VSLFFKVFEDIQERNVQRKELSVNEFIIPTGYNARVHTYSKVIKQVLGIDICESRTGKPKDVPPSPKEGVYYVVSHIFKKLFPFPYLRSILIGISFQQHLIIQ
jgi:hypothetical protein